MAPESQSVILYGKEELRGGPEASRAFPEHFPATFTGVHRQSGCFWVLRLDNCSSLKLEETNEMRPAADC